MKNQLFKRKRKDFLVKIIFPARYAIFLRFPGFSLLLSFVRNPS